VNELNCTCLVHLKKYVKYCPQCQRHFCDDKTCTCEHLNKVKKLNGANDEDLQKIKNKRDALKNLTKFLDTIIETYEKHPNNYFNTINVEKVAKTISNNGSGGGDINREEELMSKIYYLEKKILDYFFDKFKVKIEQNAREIILQKLNINDMDLELLCAVHFSNLEIFNLSHNLISNASPIKDLKAPYLRKLDLTHNKLNNIDPLINLIKNKLFKDIEIIKTDIKKETDVLLELIGGDFTKKSKLQYKLNKSAKEIRLFGEEFIKENEGYCQIIINGKKQDITEFYKYNKNELKEDYLNIELNLREKTKHLSCLFSNCDSLAKIENIFNVDTNVKDLKELFSGCLLLKELPNNISEWDISNATDLSGVFYKCESLVSIPDISNWDTINVINMMSMFNNCKSLKSLPNLSKWNTSNVTNMVCMFSNCLSLGKLPKGMSNWNTSNVEKINDMFYKCKSLVYIPDLSQWDISKIKNMKNLFYECEKVDPRPCVSKWDISNDVNKTDMFRNCLNNN
jgi:surface protein